MTDPAAPLRVRQGVTSSIAVAGDVAIDWLAYPVPAKHIGHEPPRMNWHRREGTRMVARGGGALLLARFVEAATWAAPTSYELENIETIGPDKYLHSIADLVKPKPNEKDKNAKLPDYVVHKQRGFSGPRDRSTYPELRPSQAHSILILDDAGNGFRDAEGAWGLLTTLTGFGWVVHKMSYPLARGKLWDVVHKGPPTPPDSAESSGKPDDHDPDRLIVIVNANDLREEGINISRHLSWERTAEDFVRELASNGRLAPLATCANLRVRFDCDAVIHHRGRNNKPPQLYFDPARAEEDFVSECQGRMMGLTSSFTAALAWKLLTAPADGIEESILYAIWASRAVARAGFVQVRRDDEHNCPLEPDDQPDYPIEQFKAALTHPRAEVIRAIKRVDIPSDHIGARASPAWSIIERASGPAVDEVALRVARFGLSKLGSAPVGRFNKLETADRQEIEGFRSISNLLHDYVHNRKLAKPVSIAVFGPPGAGKSFGVEEVAKSIAGDQSLKPLKFNLSQFTSPDDLVAAFHLVRDEGLRGLLPLVFFDEFDAAFGEPLGWLRFLLAPMQDGEFTDKGAVHPIGRAIFVFAGGTRPTFAAFSKPLGLPEKDLERIAFTAAKGPDFVSRLRGHVDIIGPDPVSSEDRMYSIRRAILLRSLVRKSAEELFREEPGKKAEDRELLIDEGVLRAMLRVPSYHHGARSMEAVLLMRRLVERGGFERAALPPAGQLSMHVDADAFLALVAAERLPDELRDKLGPLLHARYLEFRQQRERNIDSANDVSMRPWKTLPQHLRESNRLQADDIPRKLRAIGCFMAPIIPGREHADIKDEIDKLAEMEHERYNAERLQRRWRIGPRDAERRTNPSLRPWSALDEATKNYDRNAVLVLPNVLGSIDYGIYKLEQV